MKFIENEGVRHAILHTDTKYTEIADLYGVSTYQVYLTVRYLKQQGLTFPKRKKGPKVGYYHPKTGRGKQVEVNRDIVETTIPFIQIAEKYDVTPNYVSMLAKRLRDKGVIFPQRQRGGKH